MSEMSDKKLFCVKLEFEVFVYCEDDHWDIEDLALKALEDCGRDIDYDWEEVDDIKHVPKDWRDALPWAEGEEKDRTIKQILEQQAKDKTMPLFEATEIVDSKQ